MPASVQAAALPATPKSTSSGCAVMTRTRSTSGAGAMDGDPTRRAGQRRRVSEDRGAVEVAERVADQLDTRPVRVAEVQRGIDVLHLDAGVFEAAAELLPPIRRDRDREVMQPAEHL